MTRETLKFTREEALEILDGGDEDFETISDEICGQSRWETQHKLIVKRSDGKFFKTIYSVGSTENSGGYAWEYDDEVEFTEVFATEKTITVYE